MSSPAPETRTSNGLGLMVDRLLELGTPVWMATAFFFRGDKLPILEDGLLTGFRRVFIPFDRHFAEMEFLKSYSYDFVLYGHSSLAGVAELIRHSRAPTLFFCPQQGHHSLRGQSKSEFVHSLTALILQHDPRCELWTPALPRTARNVLVDLVDEDYRDEKTHFISTRGAHVSAVLTVAMMQEGADWPECARVIDLAPSASNQVRNQRFGRLARDHRGKEHIHYYTFLPHLPHWEEEGQRAELSRLFTHFHASLILENLVSPIRVPVRHPPERHEARRDERPGGVEAHPRDLLGEFPEPMQMAIQEEISKALVGLASGNSGTLAPGEVGPAIYGVLERMGCAAVVGADNIEALRDQIALIWRRRSDPSLEIDLLIGAGFDRIWSSDALAPLLHFTAGVCGASTFADLRDVLGRVGRPGAEAWARRYADRYRPSQAPSRSSDDPQERADALQVAHYRMYKKGKKNGVFYPSVEAILEEAGHVGIFETTDFQSEAEAWARACALRYPPGRLPSQKSGNPEERYDAQKIANTRRAKSGEGTCTFYPSVEEIFAAAGHHGVFDKADRRRTADEWAVACADRYPPGHLPSEEAKDPQARKDGKKIAHLRSARRGKGQGAFYPSVQAIFEAAGHHGVFD